MLFHHRYNPRDRKPKQNKPGRADNKQQAGNPGDPFTRLQDDALKAGRNALLQAIASEQKDIGYTIAHVNVNGQTESIFIIGVVGQETMKPISLLLTDRTICLSATGDHARNADLLVSCRDNPGSMKGTVTVINPVRTIQAILRASELMNGGKYAYRILMAHMPDESHRTGQPT